MTKRQRSDPEIHLMEDLCIRAEQGNPVILQTATLENVKSSIRKDVSRAITECRTKKAKAQRIRRCHEERILDAQLSSNPQGIE